jgi:hypothetical protein
LRATKDYGNLFYALLLKKRHELGVSTVPTGPSQDLPEGTHDAYEDAIREAARLVGGLYLTEGNIPQAWGYFRMLGEHGPVADALDRHQLGPDEDIQPLVHIAYYEGANPRKGFDLILERYGICNAITTLGGSQEAHGPQVRAYCVKRLIRALHAELSDRLRRDIANREGSEPKTAALPELIADRDWLFADEFAHIDVSHLSSVVQMSIHLEPSDELSMARELCEYGKRISPRLRYPGEPPFENQYVDYGVYLAILAGDQVESGLAHFRAKADNADPETRDTYPAQVLVNLLLRLNRPADAVLVARTHLASPDGRPMACPGLPELCRMASDYSTLSTVAREQGDPVHFMAGLIEARKMSN